jgi:photosystem II stability/assembly factor-like uncharacterized protein
MRRFLLLALCLLDASSVRAATPGLWAPAGPDGSTVLALAVDPRNAEIAFAGTDGGGLFKTGDAGESWSAVDLDADVVTAVAIDPRNPDFVYAGTPTEGLFQSRDGGSTWYPELAPANAGSVQAIVIDPLRPYVYVLVQTGDGQDLLRSADGGQFWTSAHHGLPVATSLAIDPKQPDILYASVGGSLYRTTDRGDHWKRRSRGADLPFITSLAVDSVQTWRLYAGTQESGVYHSLDGGSTWKPSRSGPANRSIAVVIAQPRTKGVVWAGATRSLAGLGHAAVFRSADGGETWSPAGTGLVSSDLHALAVSAIGPRTVYAGVETRGVFRSRDNGASWQLASRGLRPVDVTRVAADPSRSGHVLLGTEGFGVLATDDDGATWTPVDSRPLFSRITDLEYDPSDPSVAYAGAGDRMDRSLDGGDTWKPVGFAGTAFAGVFAADPSRAGRVYAVTIGKVYRSLDFGASWAAPLNGLGCLGPIDMVVAPGSAAVWVGGDALDTGCPSPPILARSTDAGVSWHSVTSYPRGLVLSLAVDPGTGTIYAGSQGVVRSPDGGTTWTAAGTIGDGPTPYVYKLLALPGVLYAGSDDHVWESRDGGATWQEVGTGLLGKRVQDLSIDADGVLWAATTRGAFRLVQ